MPATSQLTFVVATNNREVLEGNFLASPCLARPHRYTILIQQHFASAARAYNDAIDKSPNDLIIFCHQDIYLPPQWVSDVQRALDFLKEHDPAWGVLGCAGITGAGRMWGRVYSSGLGTIGQMPESPAPVQTLDEIVLILRKSSGLRFDEALPHFHLYGADICLRAAQSGKASYAIPAFCIHNTQQILALPKEFYECCAHVRKTWKRALPIQTTCIRLTRFSFPVMKRRFYDFYLRQTRPEAGVKRANDIHRVLRELTGDI